MRKDTGCGYVAIPAGESKDIRVESPLIGELGVVVDELREDLEAAVMAMDGAIAAKLPPVVVPGGVFQDAPPQELWPIEHDGDDEVFIDDMPAWFTR